MKALTFAHFGSPEVLNYTEVKYPKISKNEVLIENRAIGLNYADIYRRKGNYHLKGEPPYIAGYEGSGIIVDSKSEKHKIGDRVAYADVPFSNAEFTAVHENNIIPLPDDISFELASSILLQGLTAHYLVNDSHNIQKNEFVVIHAASGGVGQILVQLAKHKGAIVIGLTRSPDKLDTIRSCNADYAELLDKDWPKRIFEITKNNGADVVYDSIGVTLEQSIYVTKNCGHIVFYGMSGGDPKLIDPRYLIDTSKTLSGGDLWNYLTSHKERISRSSELFELLRKDIIRIKPPTIFKLSEGRKAHEYLESGKSSNKILLIPDRNYTDNHHEYKKTGYKKT